MSWCRPIFIYFAELPVSRLYNSANSGNSLKVSFLNYFFDDFFSFLFGTPVIQILEPWPESFIFWISLYFFFSLLTFFSIYFIFYHCSLVFIYLYFLGTLHLINRDLFNFPHRINFQSYSGLGRESFSAEENWKMNLRVRLLLKQLATSSPYSFTCIQNAWQYQCPRLLGIL